ncbi:DUF3857 domain-containing protein [Paludibacterium yongneupense]|uniref:DUF3857 domain-containing protein n=1 Tax=Paludibacterium yongneupense TaxID=400061 RepID=UPI00042944A6|nr:DUF3857 domain-containing protein [Paludibacterium yongneupense]
MNLPFQRLLLPLLVLSAAAAHASTVVYHPSSTQLSDDTSYDVQSDGTFVQEETQVRRINTPQGSNDFSHLLLPYDAAMQDLQIVEAYTTTPGGKRIDVTPDRIVDQQSGYGQDAPTLTDGRVKVVIAPALEPGATLTIHFRLRQKIAPYPGQFFGDETENITRDIRWSRTTVRMPDSMNLAFDAVDIPGGTVVSDQPGKKVWRWEFKGAQPHAPERNSIDPRDVSPRVQFSTFANVQSLANAYMSRARDKSEPTPAIRQLADRITAGMSDKRVQAEALYRWVATNIRYVAVYAGFGGWVPHRAEDIAKLKYGDCKDHVALLGALLAARNIRSSPVLINGNNHYWVPRIATPTSFDHAITWLPDEKIFVDSTSPIAPFGSLSPNLVGKTALVLDDGSGKARLMSVPLTSVATDQARGETHLVLDTAGNAHGETTVTASGAYEFIARDGAIKIRPGTEAEQASQWLGVNKQTGTGTLSLGNARDLTHPYVHHSQFDLSDVATLPGPGAFPIPAPLSLLNLINGRFRYVQDSTRYFPSFFLGGHLQEVTRIDLPPSMHVMALPRAAKLDTSFGHYVSDYVQSGNSVTVTRTLDLQWPTALLQPADYPAFRAMGLAVQRDLKAQILYE